MHPRFVAASRRQVIELGLVILPPLVIVQGMKAESIAVLRKALLRLEHGELLEICQRLIRFKKENKELLTYLLFLANDEPAFAEYLCEEIDEAFLLRPNMHKKTLRKTIRWMDKCVRISGVKETEVQVRIHFCRALNESETPYRRSRVMTNMYTGQIKKATRAIEKFHDDVKREYEHELHELERHVEG